MAVSALSSDREFDTQCSAGANGASACSTTCSTPTIGRLGSKGGKQVRWSVAEDTIMSVISEALVPEPALSYNDVAVLRASKTNVSESSEESKKDVGNKAAASQEVDVGDRSPRSGYVPRSDRTSSKPRGSLADACNAYRRRSGASISTGMDRAAPEKAWTRTTPTVSTNHQRSSQGRREDASGDSVDETETRTRSKHALLRNSRNREKNETGSTPISPLGAPSSPSEGDVWTRTTSPVKEAKDRRSGGVKFSPCVDGSGDGSSSDEGKISLPSKEPGSHKPPTGISSRASDGTPSSVATLGSALQKAQRERSQKERVCPKGHAMKPYTTTGRRACDGCGTTVTRGARVLDCRECNWYLCTICIPGHPGLDSPRQASKGAASPRSRSDSDDPQNHLMHRVGSGRQAGSQRRRNDTADEAPGTFLGLNLVFLQEDSEVSFLDSIVNCFFGSSGRTGRLYVG